MQKNSSVFWSHLPNLAPWVTGGFFSSIYIQSEALNYFEKKLYYQYICSLR